MNGGGKDRKKLLVTQIYIGWLDKQHRMRLASMPKPHWIACCPFRIERAEQWALFSSFPSSTRRVDGCIISRGPPGEVTWYHIHQGLKPLATNARPPGEEVKMDSELVVHPTRG